MKRYGTTAPWARPAQDLPQEVAEIETSQPARPADLVADLVVPFGQAMITGALLAGLFVVLLAEVVPDFDGDLLKVWAMIALGIAALAWLLLLVDTRRLLWAIEKLTGRDLDNDNQVGKPTERVVIVNAAKAQQEATQQANTQRASDFSQFVAGLATKGTSQRSWEPELGRATYQDYRDALIRLGWARWKSIKRDGQPNETKGW